jgi:hypothetical protein
LLALKFDEARQLIASCLLLDPACRSFKSEKLIVFGLRERVKQVISNEGVLIFWVVQEVGWLVEYCDLKVICCTKMGI